ncbi:hypothetical protein HYT45_02925 [Candidatus Uhrbacteria bacterium]|nr:hypothetical protein [Candidatus Uhrbacteria bacterium]
MNIAGMDKARVLMALYNRARCQGVGFLHFDPTPMTVEEAQKILDSFQKGRRIYFDYLKGRVMKVDITSDALDMRLYDRDNGQGAAEYAIMDEFTRPDGK